MKKKNQILRTIDASNPIMNVILVYQDTLQPVKQIVTLRNCY
jgi:hypothetical protein